MQKLVLTEKGLMKQKALEYRFQARELNNQAQALEWQAITGLPYVTTSTVQYPICTSTLELDKDDFYYKEEIENGN